MKGDMIYQWMRVLAATFCASIVLSSATLVMAQEPTKTPDNAPQQQDAAKPTERTESRVPS